MKTQQQPKKKNEQVGQISLTNQPKQTFEYQLSHRERKGDFQKINFQKEQPKGHSQTRRPQASGFANNPQIQNIEFNKMEYIHQGQTPQEQINQSIGNQINIFNASQNPGHHKANSLQINSSMVPNIINLGQKKVSEDSNLHVIHTNSNNELNQKQIVTIAKTQQQKPSSKVMDIDEIQRSGGSPTNQQINARNKKNSAKSGAVNNDRNHGKPFQQNAHQVGKIKNSHILMTNQHVKMKQQTFQDGQSNGDSSNPQINDKLIKGGFIQMSDQIQIQGQFNPPGHKKSNSQMNQKMMQLLLNKEYGGQNAHQKNKSIIIPQQMIKSHFIEPSKKQSIQNNHHKMNSQTFHVQNNLSVGQSNQVIQQQKQPIMINMMMGQNQKQVINQPGSQNQNSEKAGKMQSGNIQKIGNQNSTPQTSKQKAPFKYNWNISENQNNFMKQSKIKSSKESVLSQTKNQSTSKTKSNSLYHGTEKTSKMKGIVSNSFDKSGKSSITSKNRNNLSQIPNQVPNVGFSKKMSQQNAHIDHINAYRNASIVGTHGVTSICASSSGITGMATQLPTHMNASIRQSNAVSVIGNHQRTKSDANYIMSLNKQNKTNFVISSSNHVYQNKKSTNLQAMKQNTSISKHGATKGFLNKVGQASAIKNIPQDQLSFIHHPHQQSTMHKKNQYSTIVKSNYKNLVDSLSENNDQEEVFVSQRGEYPIEHEMFTSNQNKTTEQKYAELKMKYNDLLNKHLNLAAQKTEDNRSQTINKTNMDDRMIQSNTINLNYDQKYQKTQKQTLDANHNMKSIGITGVRPIESNENISIENQQNRQINSNMTSKNISPRSIIRMYDPSVQMIGDERSFMLGHASQEEYEQLRINMNEMDPNNPDPNYVNNIITSFEGLRNNINQLSRMEGQGPLTIGQGSLIYNKNQSDNLPIKEKKNLRVREKTHSSSYGISHKRSVSDELFTKMLPQSQINQSLQIGQIPLKQNKQSLKLKFKQDNKKQKKNQLHDDNNDNISQNRFSQERRITYSNEENLITEQCEQMLEYEIPQAINDHSNQQKMMNQKQAFIGSIQQKSLDLPLKVKQHNQDGGGKGTLSIQNVVQQQYLQVTDHSDRRSIKQHIEGDTTRKKSKKKTKSLMTSIQNQSKERQTRMVSDIDNNSITKKQQVNRKSGEYHGAVITDANQPQQTTKKGGGQVKFQGNNMTTKASGQQERFGNDSNHNKIDVNAVKAIAHRKVKSGVPEQIMQNSKQVPNIQSNSSNNQKQNQPKMLVTPESKLMSVTVTGQRSLQSISRSRKPQRDFMLIYEEHTNEEGSVGLETHGLRQHSDEMVLYQSNQQDSQGNKIINVSFNDFTNSLDNPNVENSIELDTEPQQKNTRHVQQIQTNNKNVNSFLQALQKIKPVNTNTKNVKSPMGKQSGQPPLPQQNQQQTSQLHTDQASPKKGTQKKMRKPNLSEVPTSQLPQARYEKYQKMMMKVKQSDQKEKGVHHSRIKSTNEGVSVGKVLSDNLMPNQLANRSTERQWSHERQNVSLGIPSEFEQNQNQKLKITFVGDQALLKRHNQQQSINAQPNLISNQNSCQKQPKSIKFHQNPSKDQLNSNSNSNTGGIPSPEITQKRQNIKQINQMGEMIVSPPANKGQMNVLNVKRNNFVNDNSEQQLNDLGEPNVLSDDFEESQTYSMIEKNQHHLMHNLNKGQKYLGQDDDLRVSEPAVQPRKNSDIMPFSPPTAPQVSERLITDESMGGIRGPGQESPRSKNIRKLIKLIKLSFRQQDEAPQTTIDFYRIGKVLGKGAFGKVNLAVHKLTECLCAVKSINKQLFSDESQSKKVMQEVLMLKRAKHKNIVRLYEYFETEKHLLFVIELCAGGDLLTYVRRRRRLKEDVAKCLFKQLMESLAYCHRKSIVHRDIKLDNILLDSDGNVKLCDFGVGKIVKRGEKMTEQCGTPAYIAPEILRDEGYYGFAVDIWSAGVVLYAMLYGTVPFKANNMSELQKMIMKAKYTLREDISVEARDLLKGLMEKDPAKRMTMSEVLQHSWLADAQDSRDLELFTEQDKQNIKNEFTYFKSKRYNRNHDSSALGGFLPNEMMHSKADSCNLDKDMFTEHLLDTTQNSILKNCETKSVILAPFNSTKSNLNVDLNEGEEVEQQFELSDSIKNLIESRRIIKFGARVRDIDRQYEINNNADLDNGVYHKLDEEEGQKEENEIEPNEEEEKDSDQKEEDFPNDQRQFKMDESEIMLDEEEQEILKELKKQGKAKTDKNKKQTEMQKLNNMLQEQEEQIDQNYLMLPDPPRNDGGGNLVTENSQVSPLDQSPMSMSKLQEGDQAAKRQLVNSPVFAENQGKMKIIEQFQQTKEDIRLPSSPSQLMMDTRRNADSVSDPNENTYLKNLYLRQQKDESITIQEQIVAVVEEFGYPREYLLKCLTNQELNYATTSYLLLHFMKKNNEYRLTMMMQSYDQIITNDQQTPNQSKLSQMKVAFNPQNSVCSSVDRHPVYNPKQNELKGVPDICS